MLNQSVNDFYTRFLFKIDAIPQGVVLLIDISAKTFNNLSTNVREFLISVGFQVTPMQPNETIH